MLKRGLLISLLIFCFVVNLFAATFGGSLTGGDAFANTNGVTTCSHFAAPASGTITKLTAHYVFDSGNANMRGAVYSNAAGVPGTLLVQASANTAMTITGNYDTTVSLSITNGTVYWLCVAADSAGLVLGLTNGVSGDGSIQYTGFTYPTFTNSYAEDSATANIYDIQATYTAGGGATRKRTAPMSVQ